jgi:hypothetical protein
MQKFQDAAIISGESLVVARPIPVMAAVTPTAAAAPQTPVVSAAVITSAKVATTPAVNQIRFVDPNFALRIIDIRPILTGTTRDKLTVPVAPTADFADDALFQDPADPAKHFYLPRYAVDEDRTASGQPQYAIAIHQAGNEWTLDIRLRKYAPPTLGDAARTAGELKHSIALLLRYRRMVNGAAAAVAEEPLELPPVAGELVSATLLLATLEQRDRILRALQDANSGAQLIVRRSFDIAIPVPPAPPPPPVQSPPPPPPATTVVRDHRIPPGPPPPPATTIVRDHRTQPGGGVVAGPGRVAMFAAASAPETAAVHVFSGAVLSTPPAPVPLFRQATRVLDATADPADFTFPLALHPYIYGDIGAPPGTARSLIARVVTWGGVSYTYYQDPDDTWEFSYLPDCFKLARRQGPTYEPLMKLQFAVPLDAPDPFAATRVTLEYVAVPVVDQNRLADAAAKLKPFVSVPLPAGIDGPRFTPLIGVDADKVHLRLRTAGAAGFIERPQARVTLGVGISDTLAMGLPEFQPLFDALLGAGLSLFTGEVDVSLGEGAGNSIPFAARISDAVGDVVTYKAVREGAGLRFTLSNAIESPIAISRQPATLSRGGQTCPATVSGADFTSPVSLASGAALEFLLTPKEPLSAGDDLAALLDLSGITVAPDRDRIFEKILDPSITTIPRKVHVVTDEKRFTTGEPPPTRIVVEFEGGGAVDLHPGHLEDDAEIPRSIADFVLRRGSTGAYRYRLQTSTGGPPAVSDFRDGSSDILLV